MHEMRERLDACAFPVLTASVVGHRGIDDIVMTLSRAHTAQARAYQAMLKRYGMSSEVGDVSTVLPYDHYDNIIAVGGGGQTVARNRILHALHETAAPLLRSVLHLEKDFRPTTDYFMESLKDRPGRPISSFHYAVGNAMIEYLVENKINSIPIIHYVNDPHHIHANYLIHKNQPFVFYFVFDAVTASMLKQKGVRKDHVFVTGFPLSDKLYVRPTVDEIKSQYSDELSNKMTVSVFTGGLGGNQDEIVRIAQGFNFQTQRGIFYCGTHGDLFERLKRQFERQKVKVRVVTSNSPSLALQDNDEVVIIVGQELDDELIALSYEAINEAHVVCTKPSGDIGIESLMAGKPIVPLARWGQHEGKIEEIMEDAGAIVAFKHPGQTVKKVEMKDLARTAFNICDRLEINPPFPDHWEKLAMDALKSISAKRET